MLNDDLLLTFLFLFYFIGSSYTNSDIKIIAVLPCPEGVCTVLFFGAEIQPKHLVFYYLGFLPGCSMVFCFLPHPIQSPI